MERKVVFVTGGTKNSGLAVAKKFAENGYAVALTSRREADAQAVAAMLTETYGVPAKGYRLDLRSPAEIRAVFADVKQVLGGVDALVTVGADLGMGKAALEVTEEDFDSVMETNIKGDFFCAQEAAKQMIERGGGSIVLFGSVHGRGAVWGRCLYAASKGAVYSLVRNLAVELAEYHIRVNEIVPGAIRTDRWEGISPEEEARRRRNWPSGVESTPEDIANGVFYLSSDAAKTVTGSDLVMDSGILSCLLAYNGGAH